MGNVDTGGNGVWGVGHMATEAHRCMGHIGNRDTGAMGYKGYRAHGQ